MPLRAKDALLLWVCSYSDMIYMHLCSTSACIRHTEFALVHITTDFKITYVPGIKHRHGSATKFLHIVHEYN